MKFLLRLIVVLMMGSAYAQSNLPACPSSGYFHNCFGTLTDARGIKYIGEFKDDKLHGQGTETSAKGSTYVGEYKDGKRNGQGTFNYSNGDKYVGEFKDGRYNGQGTETFANGDKYVGEYKAGARNGQGTLTFANGNKYVGEFKNRTFFNGQGTETLANGDKYIGEYKDYQRNGQGTLTRANGDKYVGEFKYGMLYGQGTLTYANGEEHIGEFEGGRLYGQGTLTYANGDKYVGEFKDSRLNGQGTYNFANGDKYVGGLKDGKYNGQGTSYLANGSISQSGIWSDNRLVTADRTTQQEEVSQKKADISIDDERLLKGYGTCDSILKATISMLNRNGLQDNPLQGIATHQLTIYTILNLNIVRKYPESLHEKAFKIMIKFAEEKIIRKSLTGSQLNAFTIENGGCSLDEVPRGQIDKIMLTEKDSYDMLFKRFKKL